MSSGSNPQTEDRIKLLKSGFKAYVNPIKLPISAETKWMLENRLYQR
jgi:ABC-type cobalt transport system substrate-binding protein